MMLALPCLVLSCHFNNQLKFFFHFIPFESKCVCAQILFSFFFCLKFSGETLSALESMLCVCAHCARSRTWAYCFILIETNRINISSETNALMLRCINLNVAHFLSPSFFQTHIAIALMELIKKDRNCSLK